MSGAGNDFIVLDARDARGVAEPAEFARRHCARGVGVGADGLLLVAAGERPGVVHAEYWNADGSPAAFCGNGARCAARFAHMRGLSEDELVLSFGGREYTAEVAKDEVRLVLPRPRWLESSVEMRLAGVLVSAERVDAGVEHVVVLEEEALPPLSAMWGALFEEKPAWEGRVNLTVVRPEGASWALRTYERGSGETLACGSAAVAAAFVVAERTGNERHTLRPPAGIPLTVEIPPAPAPVTLVGEARVVFCGELCAS